eukprot:TRINITY_DN24531_c0_g1_i1.p1 TRINITY_DN24531_c0_g1~~TRINITY_DN24531_c0_g1_i1.p1  ORF type:complete len:332 (+),score=81.91 TRINITY_DN24531_c0_g1_i1:74-1069(+)
MRRRLRDVGYLAFNFASAVGIVFVNKLCFTRVTFVFPTLLTIMHYLVTLAGASLLLRLRKSSGSPDSICPGSLTTRHWLLAVVVGWAPAVNNLALQMNPVGFYQVVKLGVTPAIVLMEWRLYSRHVSAERGIWLALITAGVAMATAGGMSETSITGVLASAVWLPIAATYKVLWSAVVREEGWDTLELMVRLIPRAMLFQVPLLLITDPLGELGKFKWTAEATSLLLLSGAGAFAVNLSGFLVMGELSALTHVVVGQGKACVTMLGGYLLYREQYPALKLLGAASAVAAMAGYTSSNLREQAQRKRAGSADESAEAAVERHSPPPRALAAT